MGWAAFIVGRSCACRGAAVKLFACCLQRAPLPDRRLGAADSGWAFGNSALAVGHGGLADCDPALAVRDRQVGVRNGWRRGREQPDGCRAGPVRCPELRAGCPGHPPHITTLRLVPRTSCRWTCSCNPVRRPGPGTRWANSRQEIEPLRARFNSASAFPRRRCTCGWLPASRAIASRPNPYPAARTARGTPATTASFARTGSQC